MVDARVGHPMRMEPEKIVVLRNHDTSGRGGELKLRRVGRADQARVHPAAGRPLHTKRRQECRRGTQGACATTGLQQGWVVTAEFLRERAFRPHLLLDLFDVIEVVREGGVDVGKSNGRDLGDNLVGRHALMFVPHHDIEHTDAVARDTGRATGPVCGNMREQARHRHYGWVDYSPRALRFTVTFHYIFPQLTMGLALLLVALKTMALRTGDEHDSLAARFWARIFAINFAMGVVTGIPIKFQFCFGTNWSRFSKSRGRWRWRTRGTELEGGQSWPQTPI